MSSTNVSHGHRPLVVPTPVPVSSNYLQNWSADVEQDTKREGEPWTENEEKLLRTWAEEWAILNTAHGAAESHFRKGALYLQLPSTLIPIVLAPTLAGGFLAKDGLVAVFLLIVSGICSGLSTLLNYDKKAEQHSQTAFKYADLLSDAEELLAKARKFRTKCDVTMQRMKMRMDAVSRYAPPVSVPVSDDVDE